MSDDTRKILDLLAAGKVTVDEAQALLAAVSAPRPAEGAPPMPDGRATSGPQRSAPGD